MRPWSPIPIHDNGEPLLPLPPLLQRIEPHPYRSLGAPYGPDGCPFRLRQGVIRRLEQAQRALAAQAPGWRLAIFDAWRPVTVQRFMVAHAYASECRSRGLDPAGEGPAQQAVHQEVGRFWAPPSDDPATPPPHSTGAAVDLTLADAGGRVLDMGGEIDAIGPVSELDHHAAAAAADPDGPQARWQQRRQLLHQVMVGAGFAQHPNEWWHFSHGDQLWAWRQGQPTAHYGRWDGAVGAESKGESGTAVGAA
ncbi:MAG: M15 family metallopeptidase [Cyanobium sp.]